MDRVRSKMVSLQAEIAKGNEKLAKGQSKIVNQIRFKQNIRNIAKALRYK